MFIPNYEDALLAWARVEPRLREIEGGCLILSEKPYRPTVTCAGRQGRLARVAFVAAGGTIPESTTCLRHACDDLHCVAPDHLVPGDDLANAHDRRDRDRGGVGWKDGRWCARGHDTEATGVYLVRRPNSEDLGRVCAECARERARKHSPRQAERRRQRREVGPKGGPA